MPIWRVAEPVVNDVRSSRSVRSRLASRRWARHRRGGVGRRALRTSRAKPGEERESMCGSLFAGTIRLPGPDCANGSARASGGNSVRGTRRGERSTPRGGWRGGCGRLPRAPPLAPPVPASTSSAITAGNSSGLSVPCVSSSGTVVVASAAVSIDSGCRIGQLVEVGGGVGLQHRPERLREPIPRARPEGDVLDEVFGSVAVVPRADQVPHDREVGVGGRQRVDESLIAVSLRGGPTAAARGPRRWRPGRGVR